MGPDQTLRLRAAALIKQVADSEETFENAWCEELAELLQPMPFQRSSMKVSFMKSGTSVEGEAAGVGNASFQEEDTHKTWSTGERSFRCGAYVVEKLHDTEFEIRHVAEIHAEMNAGEQLKLVKQGDDWFGYLNEPRIWSFFFVHLVLGSSWALWKEGT